MLQSLSSYDSTVELQTAQAVTTRTVNQAVQKCLSNHHPPGCRYSSRDSNQSRPSPTKNISWRTKFTFPPSQFEEIETAPKLRLCTTHRQHPISLLPHTTSRNYDDSTRSHLQETQVRRRRCLLCRTQRVLPARAGRGRILRRRGPSHSHRD